MDDNTEQVAVERARLATLNWLDGMQAENAPAGVSRISSWHDPVRWPGMLLPGTYNAVLCRHLMDGAASDPAGLVRWLLRHRRNDGVFRIAGMHDPDVFKKPDYAETWRYINFHVTNYTLGAIEALDPDHRPVLEFARPYLDTLTLQAWLGCRDLRDPWQEGNNIVNLASFLLLMRRFDGEAIGPAFQTMFDWHDRLQEPSTGFWGVGQHHTPTGMLHAMAGSMHNYHLWYAVGRKLPYQDRAVDYALSRPTTIDSACIDVDLVDLLIHAHAQIDYRRRDTEAWLRGKLAALLAFQSPDGGFADEMEGVRRQDGWIRGYEEPQGLSNTFATWFRWIAIAMIADTLWPGWRVWRFRRTIGIGYRGTAPE